MKEIIGILLFVGFMIYLFVPTRKESERDYEDTYRKLTELIDKGDFRDYEYICTGFAILRGLKYKNPEKTDVLWHRFLMAYQFKPENI